MNEIILANKLLNNFRNDAAIEEYYGRTRYIYRSKVDSKTELPLLKKAFELLKEHYQLNCYNLGVYYTLTK